MIITISNQIIRIEREKLLVSLPSQSRGIRACHQMPKKLFIASLLIISNDFSQWAFNN